MSYLFIGWVNLGLKLDKKMVKLLTFRKHIFQFRSIHILCNVLVPCRSNFTPQILISWELLSHIVKRILCTKMKSQQKLSSICDDF